MDTNNMKQDKFYVYRALPDMIDVKCSKCGGVVATLHDSDVEQVDEKTYITKKEISCRACNETIPAGMLIAKDRQSLNDFSLNDSTLEKIKKANEEAEQSAERAVINSSNEKNTVATILQVYAIINAVLGVILSFVIAAAADYVPIAGLIFSVVPIGASFLIYAFGEVIKLLHEIKLNTRKAANGK